MKETIKLFKALTIRGEVVEGLLSESQGHGSQPKEAGFYISNRAGMPWAYHVRPETIRIKLGELLNSELNNSVTPEWPSSIAESSPILWGEISRLKTENNELKYDYKVLISSVQKLRKAVMDHIDILLEFKKDAVDPMTKEESEKYKKITNSIELGKKALNGK